MSNKLSTEKFIERCKELFYDKSYDYTETFYQGSFKSASIVCKKHGKFTKIATDILRGQGCVTCSKENRRYTTESFIHAANIIHNFKYTYELCEYTTSKEKVKITCNLHGVFQQISAKHLHGRGCPRCGGSSILTTDEFIKKAIKIHGNKYGYSLTEYTNNKTPVKITCGIHGVFKQKPIIHIRGSGCNKCGLLSISNKLRSSTNEFVSKAKKIHGNNYNYSRVDYEKKDNKVNITCLTHGEFEQTPGSHLKGSGCNRCGILTVADSKRKSTEEFIIKAKEIHGDLYDYSNVDYIAAKSKVIIICSKHGEFKQTPDAHTHGSGCKKCSNIISKPETEIIDFINSFSNYKIFQNDRTVIYPKELDIYIPEKQLAIEYCGLHWHSEQAGKSKNYHSNKLKMCKQKEIRLITIFEDEWLYKTNQIKEKIKYILGVDDRIKIFARNCNIVELSSEEKNKFFNEKHIQGSGPGSISYGLEHNNNVVAAITFIKQKNDIYILNRYATSNHVVGGFSKLLNKFKINNEWKEIITFADLRWSDGNLYEKCGFVLDKILKPDYSYINKTLRTREHKFNYRHSNLNKRIKNYDPQLSEKENVDNNGIERIWDCGKYKYSMKKHI